MASPAVKKSVELFYDVVSPYTWIAFETLCRYRTQWNIDLKFKPFLLGAIMSEAGNTPPGMVPNKGAHALNDLHRLRTHYHVPLARPENPAEVMFEKGSLSAMRFITAVNMKEPQKTEDISRELWMRIWHRDQDITLPDSFAEAGKSIGLSEGLIKECLAMIKTEPIKTALKNTSQEALEYGAFGSPTIIAHDSKGKAHMVFGSDRMHILADILGETYTGPHNELAAYKSKL